MGRGRNGKANAMGSVGRLIAPRLLGKINDSEALIMKCLVDFPEWKSPPLDATSRTPSHITHKAAIQINSTSTPTPHKLHLLTDLQR